MSTPLFQKARDDCYKKNCAAITKRKSKIDKKLKKLTKKRCSKYDTEIADIKDFFMCRKKVEDETGYTKWFKDMVKCNKDYCEAEQTNFINAISAKLKSSKKGGSKKSLEKLKEQLNTCKNKKCKKEYTLQEEVGKITSTLRKACKENRECIMNVYNNRELKKKQSTANNNANACVDKFCINERKAYGNAFIEENNIVPINNYDKAKLVIKALLKKGGTKKYKKK